MGKNNTYTKTKTPGALYPLRNIDNQYLEPYKGYLDIAIEDKDINNIAISAPYSGGKTSILMSYFSNNYDGSKYKFITLPNFFGENEKASEEVLQEKIIEQLLYSSNPGELPYSKISRITDRPYWKETLELLSLVTVIIFIGVFINKFDEIINPTDITWAGFIFILLFLATIVIGTYFYRNFKIKVSNSTVDVKSNLINISTTTDEDKDNDDLKTFSMYSEELFYYFRATDTEYIIFEDLDRFNNPKIFQDLRELNENINKQSFKNKKKVVFIYSLRDSIFG